MGIRVHQLAKELKISSKELIEKLHKLKVDVHSHMSTLDEETVKIVKEERVAVLKAAQKPKEVIVEHTKIKPPEEIKAAPEELVLKKIQLPAPITVKELSIKLKVSVGEVIKKLLSKRIIATINQQLDEDTLKRVVSEFGFEFERMPTAEEVLLAQHQADDPSKLKQRAPVVTFMGHVDHGKTSLLDTIRKTKVTEEEAGGITQHIGAYEVALPKGKVTFLDTPGHEAFTQMRARGANVTDIVVLVIAADDGIMPQTVEAIDHAKAAGVPIVAAINKIDKPNINIDKVKKQLMELGLMPEDWGGKTICVGVSAKTGQGIDELLEMLLLEAELLELKANSDRLASGIIIEAELSKGRGPVATVLVLNGTLRVGDIAVAGAYYGKIRAMLDDKGHNVKGAGPSMPVEILGLSGVPQAGERFYVVEDEKKAKEIVLAREQKLFSLKAKGTPAKITLEDLYSRIKEGKVKELRIVIKTDVQGSLEALRTSLERLGTEEVKLSVIHAQVGGINESDVMLAAASEAIIIGFHVDINPQAKAKAAEEGIDIRLYEIIYEVVADIKAAMEGLLEPQMQEVFLGRAEVRQTFKVSKVGVVAGCFITKGRIPRDSICRIIRDGKKIFEGKISSLKHFKDDVREVKEGFECGISFGFEDIKVGDIIEAVEIRKIARRL